MVRTIRVFCEGSNTDISLTICKDHIIVPSKLQGYVLHWYYTYLLHPGMDRTEVIIRQHFYWTNIRYAVLEEVNNCDTCQSTNKSNKNMVNYQLS